MKSSGLTSITVAGRKIPLRFCLWALRQTCKNLGITLEGFFQKFKGSDKRDEGGEQGSGDEGGEGGEQGAGFFEMLDFYAECFKEAANHELPADAVPYDLRQAYGWIEELGFSSDAVKDAIMVLMESITYQVKEQPAAAQKSQTKKKP